MKPKKLFLRAAHAALLWAILSACGASFQPINPTRAVFPPSEQLPAPEGISPPPVFQTDLLNPLDTPRAYIQDECKYLRSRWNPWGAEPGTVVMVIHFGEVYRGSGSADGIEINLLKDLMKQLKAQDFVAINTRQLLGFMERNVKIPPRSVVFVRDGNFSAENYERYFGDYWRNWRWSIVNGWVSSAEVTEELWQDQIMLEQSGFVDHQAQGINGDTFFTDESSKVIITRELTGALDAFSLRFEKKPLAFIWPQGGFGNRPVEAARLLGYQLGFTFNARGPLMYNWVPQADAYDPQRPTYIPEGGIQDPLMTLPRYLPSEALAELDHVRVIGNNAYAYAQANKAAELEYYETVCEADYGPIPSP